MANQYLEKRSPSKETLSESSRTSSASRLSATAVVDTSQFHPGGAYTDPSIDQPSVIRSMAWLRHYLPLRSPSPLMRSFTVVYLHLEGGSLLSVGPTTSSAAAVEGTTYLGSWAQRFFVEFLPDCFPLLEVCCLRQVGLTDDCVLDLVQSCWASALTTHWKLVSQGRPLRNGERLLELSSHSPSSALSWILRERHALPRLRKLDFSDNQLTSRCAEAIGSIIQLWGTSLSPVATGEEMPGEWHGGVEELDLSGNVGLGDQGLESLGLSLRPLISSFEKEGVKETKKSASTPLHSSTELPPYLHLGLPPLPESWTAARRLRVRISLQSAKFGNVGASPVSILRLVHTLSHFSGLREIETGSGTKGIEVSSARVVEGGSLRHSRIDASVVDRLEYPPTEAVARSRELQSTLPPLCASTRVAHLCLSGLYPIGYECTTEALREWLLDVFTNTGACGLRKYSKREKEEVEELREKTSTGAAPSSSRWDPLPPSPAPKLIPYADMCMSFPLLTLDLSHSFDRRSTPPRAWRSLLLSGLLAQSSYAIIQRPKRNGRGDPLQTSAHFLDALSYERTFLSYLRMCYAEETRRSCMVFRSEKAGDGAVWEQQVEAWGHSHARHFLRMDAASCCHSSRVARGEDSTDELLTAELVQAFQNFLPDLPATASAASPSKGVHRFPVQVSPSTGRQRRLGDLCVELLYHASFYHAASGVLTSVLPPSLTQLRVLDLSYSGFSDHGARALCLAVAPPSFGSRGGGTSTARRGALQTSSRSPVLPLVEALHLSGNYLTATGCVRLIQTFFPAGDRKPCPFLKQLFLRDEAGVRGEHLAAVAAAVEAAVQCSAGRSGAGGGGKIEKDNEIMIECSACDTDFLSLGLALGPPCAAISLSESPTAPTHAVASTSNVSSSSSIASVPPLRSPEETVQVLNEQLYVDATPTWSRASPSMSKFVEEKEEEEWAGEKRGEGFVISHSRSNAAGTAAITPLPFQQGPLPTASERLLRFQDFSIVSASRALTYSQTEADHCSARSSPQLYSIPSVNQSTLEVQEFEETLFTALEASPTRSSSKVTAQEAPGTPLPTPAPPSALPTSRDQKGETTAEEKEEACEPLYGAPFVAIEEKLSGEALIEEERAKGTSSSRSRISQGSLNTAGSGGGSRSRGPTPPPASSLPSPTASGAGDNEVRVVLSQDLPAEIQVEKKKEEEVKKARHSRAIVYAQRLHVSGLQFCLDYQLNGTTTLIKNPRHSASLRLQLREKFQWQRWVGEGRWGAQRLQLFIALVKPSVAHSIWHSTVSRHAHDTEADAEFGLTFLLVYLRKPSHHASGGGGGCSGKFFSLQKSSRASKQILLWMYPLWVQPPSSARPWGLSIKAFIRTAGWSQQAGREEPSTAGIVELQQLEDALLAAAKLDKRRVSGFGIRISAVPLKISHPSSAEKEEGVVRMEKGWTAPSAASLERLSELRIVLQRRFDNLQRSSFVKKFSSASSRSSVRQGTGCESDPPSWDLPWKAWPSYTAYAEAVANYFASSFACEENTSAPHQERPLELMIEMDEWCLVQSALAALQRAQEDAASVVAGVLFKLREARRKKTKRGVSTEGSEEPER